VIDAAFPSEPGFRDPPPVAVVTGASGWLGRSLVRALGSRGGTIRALVRTSQEASELELAANGISTTVGDVRDPAALDRLLEGASGASVFHAAAVIHPARATREFFDVNVGGTALVLDRVRRFGLGRVVYVSSNSPFGFNRSVWDVFDEESPYRPHLGYGQSKMEAEILVRRMVDAGSLEAVIVRCPWFYGPHQPGRQTRFFAMVRRGIFPLFGDGSNRRSLVYTENLVQGLLRAELREGVESRAYWIADERPYPMRAIVETVRDALRAEGLRAAQRTARLPGIGADVARWADALLQARGRYSQQLHVLGEMNRTIACSIDRARRELGYEPKIDLGEGMRRSIRWCIEHGEAL
jgi:nucleoside-diphosphate-sugar epimerase